MLGLRQKTLRRSSLASPAELWLSLKHVAELSRLVVQCIVAHAKKIHEHQFATGRKPVVAAPAAIPMMADSVMAYRSPSIGAELRPQPLVTLQHTAKGLF